MLILIRFLHRVKRLCRAFWRILRTKIENLACRVVWNKPTKNDSWANYDVRRQSKWKSHCNLHIAMCTPFSCSFGERNIVQISRTVVTFFRLYFSNALRSNNNSSRVRMFLGLCLSSFEPCPSTGAKTNLSRAHNIVILQT